MSDFEQRKIEMELKTFTSRNFEKPSNCRNAEQIRYYVAELCKKIESLEHQFKYVPDWAYTLLAQYNAAQNSLLYKDFKSTYC
jgi:hypothetical protein